MTNKQQLLIMAAATVALAVIATHAFADSNTNNGVGNTINDVNGVGNSVGNVGSNSNNPVTANGGSSHVHNSQTQSQEQSQSISHSGNSTIKNSGNSASYSSARGGSVKDSGNSSAAGGSANGSGNSSNSYVAEAQKRNPVNTAFAAPLTAAEDTCMGSSSVGGQGVGFGLSVGSTWRDADCVRRKDARELHNMGQRKAALALMCQNADIARAMLTAGTPCPGTQGKLSPSAGAEDATKSVSNKAADDVIYEYPTSAKRIKW